jgi:hypothetical protein
MSDDPRERHLDDETLRYLEALLSSIVYGAGAFVITLFDILFRTRRFDAMLLAETPQPAGDSARGGSARARRGAPRLVHHVGVTQPRGCAKGRAWQSTRFRLRRSRRERGA